MESLSELAFSITHLIAFAAYCHTVLRGARQKLRTFLIKGDSSGTDGCVWMLQDSEERRRHGGCPICPQPPPLTPSRSDPMLHTDTGGVISLHCMHMVCGPLLEIAQRMRHSLLCDYGNSSLWWARTGIILLCRIINGNYYHLGLCAFFFYPYCVLIVMVWTF